MPAERVEGSPHEGQGLTCEDVRKLAEEVSGCGPFLHRVYDLAMLHLYVVLLPHADRFFFGFWGQLLRNAVSVEPEFLIFLMGGSRRF